MKENRKFVRLRSAVGIGYRFVGKGKKQKLTQTLVKNISGSGVSFAVKEPLRAGQLVEMHISIPHLQSPIRAVGEVAWSTEAEAGLRYRDVKPEDLNHILEYVYAIGIG